jgi:hypothetical protein
MRRFSLIVALLLPIAGCQVIADSASDPLCKPLQSFVSSIEPGATREVVFHTSWGGGFKGQEKSTLYSKQCDHAGYEPAKAVCDSLMDNGAVEFSGNNAKRAISCLSKDTHFANRVQMSRGVFHFNYGTDDRGANIEVSFTEDATLGGTALRVTADGY